MFDNMANAFGPNAWIIIAVLALVIFGGSRIPEMMRGLGSGVKEFKKGIKEEEEVPAEKPKEEEKKP